MRASIACVFLEMGPPGWIGWSGFNLAPALPLVLTDIEHATLALVWRRDLAGVARWPAGQPLSSQNHFGDGLKLHEGGAFVDLANLRVAQVFLDRVVFREPIAAVNLDRL